MDATIREIRIGLGLSVILARAWPDNDVGRPSHFFSLPDLSRFSTGTFEHCLALTVS
jgi:hypothetical protein